jgi:hypothetical protein
MPRFPTRLFLAALVLLPFAPLSAVIFYGTADIAHNTTAPTGPLAGSGWEYQGQWGGFLGTPIAPKYFISAEHLGGSVGSTFAYGGTTYTTTAVYDDPNSDLRIWKISGTFPTYAPLYTGSDETGKLMVIFGRGRQRGVEIINGTLRGWRWGNYDGVMRWGTNVVTGIFDGGSSYGRSLLGADFNTDAGVDEVTIAEGDSGGAGFIQEDGVWKFAGINSWVDGPYNTVPNGSNSFPAAMFNEAGYFYDSLTSNGQVTEIGNGPGSLFLTRVSSQLAWIQSITGSTYADWSGGSSPAEDPNNDGVPNLLAYAIGAVAPASDAASRLPRVDPDGSFTLGDSSKTDVLYEVRLSEDLVTWYSVAIKSPGGSWTLNPSSGYSQQANITLSGSAAVSVRDSTPAPKKFWRLRVAQ